MCPAPQKIDQLRDRLSTSRGVDTVTEATIDLWRLPYGRFVSRPDYIPVEWMDRIAPEIDADGKVHLMWTGWNNGKGHAKFSKGGKPTYCYRHIVETVTGMVLRRFDYVDHLCKRKPCLTYECFEVVSPRVNTERGPGKGFWFRPK
jgi:hypothetical protein